MEETQQWFVMRDLCRGLANQYTYEKLASQGFETFAPTVARRKTVRGHVVGFRGQVPEPSIYK